MNNTLSLNKTQSLGNVANIHEYKCEDSWFKFKSINSQTGKIDLSKFHLDAISIMIIDNEDFYLGIDGMIKQAHRTEDRFLVMDIMDKLEEYIGVENCVRFKSNGQTMLVNVNNVSGIIIKQKTSGSVGVILGVKGFDQHKSDKTLTQYIPFESMEEAEEFAELFW